MSIILQGHDPWLFVIVTEGKSTQSLERSTVWYNVNRRLLLKTTLRRAVLPVGSSCKVTLQQLESVVTSFIFSNQAEKSLYQYVLYCGPQMAL